MNESRECQGLRAELEKLREYLKGGLWDLGEECQPAQLQPLGGQDTSFEFAL